MKVYAWLIDLIHRRKTCPMGMISGWVQKSDQIHVHEKKWHKIWHHIRFRNEKFLFFFQWKEKDAKVGHEEEDMEAYNVEKSSTWEMRKVFVIKQDNRRISTGLSRRYRNSKFLHD